MQEFILQPGEQILIKAAEPVTVPEPQPTDFKVLTLENNNKWRHYSHLSASVGQEYLSFGLYVDPETRQWIWCFRFIDIVSGESRYVPAPAGIGYNAGVRCELHRRGDKLILWGGVASGQGVQAYECTLIGIPVTEVRLDHIKKFNDTNSRAMSGTFLKSGAFVGSWYQHTATADQDILIGVAYRSPHGTWSSETFNMRDGRYGGRITSCNGYAIAQHPADDKIWVFYKRDSYHLASALSFFEIAGGLELNQLHADFISARSTKWVEGHSPEGENPSMEVVAMPDRGTLLLGFQSDKQIIFKVEYEPAFAFIKGSWPVFTEIDANGEFLGKQFNLEKYHERLADFGMLYHDNKLWVTYNQMHEDIPDTFKTPMQIYGSSYDFGTDQWSEAVELGMLQGYPLNNVNQPHSEARDIAALTFHSPDNTTTLVTVK
jgi:hypothetical protein